MGVGISTVKAFFWATGIQFSSVQFTDQLAFASIGVLFFCDTYKNETSGCSEKVPNVLEYTFASTRILKSSSSTHNLSSTFIFNIVLRLLNNNGQLARTKNTHMSPATASKNRCCEGHRVANSPPRAATNDSKSHFWRARLV